MPKTTTPAVLKPPASSQKPGVIAQKIARAMEVREISSKARQGRPLAFPTSRQRP